MKLWLAVGLGALIGNAAWAAPLDGSKWKVALTPNPESAENGATAWEDELVFAADQMTTMTCAKSGFKTSVYLVTEGGAVLKWQTIQHSETDGVANWQGQVEGKKMTGKLVITRRDGTREVYALSGQQE